MLGHPFLDWLLRALKRQGVRNFVLATGYLGNQIEEYFGNGSPLGVSIRISREASPLGTAGALRLALQEARGPHVLVLNGDSYGRLELRELLRTHVEAGASATLQLAQVDDATRYATVESTDNGRVLSYREKQVSGPGWISAGIYLFERSVIEALPRDSQLSIEEDLLPRLVGRGLFAVKVPGPFVDIGTPESNGQADSILRQVSATEYASEEAGHAQLVQDHFRQTVVTKEKTVAECLPAILQASGTIAEAFTVGHKLLLCGNGGSAADCQHMAAEFVGRLHRDVEHPGRPAIALTTDTSFITAYANDVGYERIFARQVEALGQPGDVLLAISTSGTSANVLRAVETARARGMYTIGLLGDKGDLAVQVDVAIRIPSAKTQIIQESMLAIEHAICSVVERVFEVDSPQTLAIEGRRT